MAARGAFAADLLSKAEAMMLISHKFDKAGAALADGHYSRRTIGSPQFMPPGETIVLVGEDKLSVFGWWRPDPRSGLQSMNGLDGWTCSIFRNTSRTLSSAIILECEKALVVAKKQAPECGPDGMLSYVWDAKISSPNPGYCFKMAGWIVHPTRPRSADRKKTLLWKPYSMAGVAP
jgi:hypothetical protein